MSTDYWSQRTTSQLSRDVRGAVRDVQAGALLLEEVRDGGNPMYLYSDWTNAAESLWSAAQFLEHLYERLCDSEEQAEALAHLNMSLMDGEA